MQPYPARLEDFRPRRQIHPPSYLQDYDLGTSRNHANQSYTAQQQQAQGTEDRQQYMSEEGPPYSRASSPMGQSGLDPMRNLTDSLEEGLLQASKWNIEPSHHVPGPPSPLLQPISSSTIIALPLAMGKKSTAVITGPIQPIWVTPTSSIQTGTAS